jgi:hypothetical protein
MGRGFAARYAAKCGGHPEHLGTGNTYDAGNASYAFTGAG